MCYFELVPTFLTKMRCYGQPYSRSELEQQPFVDKQAMGMWGLTKRLIVQRARECNPMVATGEPGSSVVLDRVKKGNVCGKADTQGKYHQKARFTSEDTERTRTYTHTTIPTSSSLFFCQDFS